MVLVTGRHYPFETAKAEEPGKKFKPSLPKLPSPPTLPSLDRTAVDVALESFGIWDEDWANRPAIVAAILRFFDYTWQHLVDYGSYLE